jgi:cytochrome b6-f complex iron-sulfur subunit
MSVNPVKEGLFAPRETAPAGVGDPTVAVGAPVAGARPGIPRRLVLRWGLWGMILALLAQWGVQFIGFFWPKKVGAFGGVITAGNVDDYQVGDVKRINEGKFYLSRVPEGFLALWWKCPHLGCTVPWVPDAPSLDTIEPKGKFNCPCHGSQYDRYGQIIQGPAPRPMDMFPITIEGGKIRVKTGTAIQRVKADHQKDPVKP